MALAAVMSTNAHGLHEQKLLKSVLLLMHAGCSKEYDTTTLIGGCGSSDISTRCSCFLVGLTRTNAVCRIHIALQSHGILTCGNRCSMSAKSLPNESCKSR